MMVRDILICLGAYTVGALPIGFWIARLRGIADIRRHGSGNIGATNVARILGIHYFILIFLLDAGKAYAYIALLVAHDYNFLCIVGASVALLIGNTYSFFLHGKGGKGVATSYGLLCALVPQLALLEVIVFFIALLITRTVGIASVIASFYLPWYAWYNAYDNVTTALFVFIALLITWRHKVNIQNYFVLETRQ